MGSTIGEEQVAAPVARSVMEVGVRAGRASGGDGAKGEAEGGGGEEG